MKKVRASTAFILILVFVCCVFTSCGSKSKPQDGEGVKPTQTVTQEKTQEGTQEKTQAPTQEASYAQTQESTEAPTVAPTEVQTDTPTAVPTATPTEAQTVASTTAPTDVPTQEESSTQEPQPEDPTQKYTVTFCDWDGTVLYTQTVSSGSAAVFPAEEIERDGYRFDGWDKPINRVTQDMTVTAKYVEVVEVQFVDYDGTVIYSEFLDKGTDFENIPPAPERADYHFTGWSTNVFSDVVEDLTVYAQYVRTYRVAFVDHDGTVLKSENVVSGTAAKAPVDPSREGYAFVGWNKSFDNVTTHLTVTAVYEINQHTVTFAMPDGTVLAQKSVKHGYRVIAPEVSETYFHLGASNAQYTFVTGYYFTGWDRSLENIAEDQTITAVYGKAITEPLIAVSRKIVITSQGTDVEIKVHIINGNAPCGISLDLQIDQTLLKGGIPTVKAEGYQDKYGSEYYESDLNHEGRYEFRWTKNSGIQTDTIVTFTFKLNASENQGEYPIDVLNSTYIITSDLKKVTPVLIDGAVIVQK